VTIPNSVTSVGNYAFAYNALTTVTFLGDAPTAGTTVFYDNSGLTCVTRSFTATGWGSTWSGVPVGTTGCPTPSPSPTASPTPTPSPSPTASPTPTPSPGSTASPTPTPSLTNSPEPLASSDPEPLASSDPELLASSDPEPSAGSNTEGEEPSPTEGGAAPWLIALLLLLLSAYLFERQRGSRRN
jgi:hypothetical protein